MNDIEKFKKLQKEAVGWSDSLFGYGRGPILVLLKLKEELIELKENYYDRFEYADNVLLLLDASKKAGINIDNILQECFLDGTSIRSTDLMSSFLMLQDHLIYEQRKLRNLQNPEVHIDICIIIIYPQLQKNPYDPNLYARLFNHLLSSAFYVGLNSDDLIQSCFDKLEINKNREWEPVNKDGLFKHKKDENER